MSAALGTLRRRAATCTACELWRLGTQTVFGEGPASAEVMLVGEQPGTGRIARDDRSSGPPVVSWTGRSTRRAWIGIASTSDTRDVEMAAFVDDLRVVADALRS
jgi:uracil-DNA glycosylase